MKCGFLKFALRQCDFFHLHLLQRYTLHVTFLLMEFSKGGREGIVYYYIYYIHYL